MKKKLITIALSIAASVFFVACGSASPGNSIDYAELPDSDSIAEQLKELNSNVGEIQTFDESTDPNGLLGRPDGYISKTDFEDTRLDQYSPYLTGGTIEIFEDSSDCDGRYEYLKTLQDSSLGMFALNQYMYKYDKILFRVEYDLTPEQAEEYHKQFDKIMEQYQDISTQKSDTGTDSSE